MTVSVIGTPSHNPGAAVMIGGAGNEFTVTVIEHVSEQPYSLKRTRLKIVVVETLVKKLGPENSKELKFPFMYQSEVYPDK
jgi:hypothetical protein